MRLFIAVNLNLVTLTRLCALRDELRWYSERGNFSRDENLHLTLAFLGECERRDTAPDGRLRRVMDSLEFEPFDITIDQCCSFPHPRHHQQS